MPLHDSSTPALPNFTAPPVSLPKLLVILGPTASGKTDLAVALAKKFRGEVISADSRQFYKGTDIGSDIIPGKWVKRGSRRIYIARGVPHHLLAFRPVSRPFTVAEFRTVAIRLARKIASQGRLPILAGGSGLYLRAVAENYQIPQIAADPALRGRLERRSTASLLAELKRRDPVYAARIMGPNRRYITRALEVILKTGRPFSELQTRGEPEFDVLKLGVRRPRREIYRRIEARVDEQIRRGLLAEAKKLGQRHGWDLPAMSALGHRQLGEHLAGRISLEEAVRLIKRDTRHYAKRQLTWFKKDKGVKWIKSPQAAARLVKKWLN